MELFEDLLTCHQELQTRRPRSRVTLTFVIGGDTPDVLSAATSASDALRHNFVPSDPTADINYTEGNYSNREISCRVLFLLIRNRLPSWQAGEATRKQTVISRRSCSRCQPDKDIMRNCYPCGNSLGAVAVHFRYLISSEFPDAPWYLCYLQKLCRYSAAPLFPTSRRPHHGLGAQE